jgi:hypothetical protein
MAFQITNSQSHWLSKNRQNDRLGIRHLKRHQNLQARVLHRPIQKLNKIAKTFCIFHPLQNFPYVKILLGYSKSIVDSISVIILA